MRKFDRERYQRYMDSPQWQAKRQQVLARAGYRCEFEAEAFASGDFYGVRCEKEGGLHVHHLTYDRLGYEKLSDLIAVCPFHHLASHLLMLECTRCGDGVYHHAEDAETEAECWYGRDDPIEDFAIAMDSVVGSVDHYCDYCGHMMGKDD